MEPRQVGTSLKWHEWVWIGLPAPFMWRNGLLTLAVVLPTIWINAKVFRGGLPTPLKYLVSGGFMVGAVVTYLILVAMVVALLSGAHMQ